MPVRRLICWMLAACLVAAANADHVTLTNGLRLDGEPVERPAVMLGISRRPGIYPLYTIEDGVRRYFVPRGLVNRDKIVYDDKIGQIRFERDPRVRASDFEPQAVGFVDQTVPFNSEGRRTVSVTTNKGLIDLAQEASLITPDFIELETLNFDWSYGLLTSELSDESLQALLSAGVTGSDKAESLKRVQFLLQAGRFEMARGELTHLRQQFPELAEQFARFEEELPKLYGYKAMQEIRRLREAGRHAAVMAYCKQLTPDQVAPSTVAEADELLREYEELAAAKDEAVFALATLEGELPEELSEAVRPLRSLLVDELNIASFDRLQPFQDLADVEGISAEEKLALAYSGWVVGPALASEDLQHAIDLWRYREAALHTLRSDNRYDFDDRLQAVLAVDGVEGNEAAAALPLLPPVRRTDIPGDGRLSLVAADGTPYLVQLPPEYHPAHKYPTVVALHSRGMKPEDELSWWLGGTGPLSLAAKRGVIVIAPQYRDRTEPTPGEVETRVLAVLRDARSRFRIDSDHVILGGHFSGGDSVFDIGFCRPDIWAGIIPIGGRCGDVASKAWRNAEGLPIYCVSGGFDTPTFNANARPLDSLMIRKSPVVLCEYLNRGRESFRGEIQRIYDWIAVQRRRPLSRELERSIYTTAPLDNGLLRIDAVPTRPGEPPRVQRVSARVVENVRTGDNTLNVDTKGRPATVWLTTDIASYGERVPIKTSGRRRGTMTPEASAEVALRDFHARFDRERVFTFRVDVE